MALPRSVDPAIDVRDVGVALAWIVAFVLLVPVQLASIIVFDSTGLDTAVPDLVFVAVVPALVLAVFPTAAARRAYTRSTAGLTAGIAFAGFALVATYTRQFYAMCGPGC